jgi:hypothetical protein
MRYELTDFEWAAIIKAPDRVEGLHSGSIRCTTKGWPPGFPPYVDARE